jgi:heptosyltransferase I
MTNKINSICIVRLSAIGDATHVLPVIATLQKNYPNAKITWVIGMLEYKLMQGLEGVDFVIYDKKKGFKGYLALRKQLKHITFDALLHMQYSLRGNIAAWMIKAKTRIGFDKKRSRELHGFRLNKRIQAVDKQHVLDGFMEFAVALDIKEKIYQWNITTSDKDKEYAAGVIDKDKKNVIISPCSSNKLRNWSNENYAIICDYIIEKYGAQVILCSSPSPFEKQTAQQIEKLAKHSVTNVAGKDTLKQLFAMMDAADLVISPDSGPMHIANAAQTPVIGLHGATTSKRSGAYSFRHLAVDCFDQAAKEILKKPVDDIRWGGQIIAEGVMDLISVDAVKEKIDEVLFK